MSNLLSAALPTEINDLAEIQRIRKHRHLNERFRYYKPTAPPDNDQEGFHASDADERWIFGGNRSGKTEAGVADCLMFIAGKHPVRSLHRQPPVKFRYCAPKWRDGVVNVLLIKFKEMTPYNMLQGGKWQKAWMEKEHKLYFENGSWIQFKSYEEDLDTFGGVDLDGVGQDEHSPESYYKENQARLADRNGYFISTMTPEEGVTWEEDHVLDPPEEITVDYRFFDTEHNPYLDKKGVEKFKAAIKDPNLREAKLHGRFVPLTGMILPQWNPAVHIIPDRKLHPDAIKAFCIDTHIKTPSAAMWTAKEPNGDIIVYRTSKKAFTVPQWKNHIRVESAGENILYWLLDETERETTGTNIYNKKSILHEFNNGDDPFDFVQVTKGPNSYEAGIYRLRNMLAIEPLTRKPKIYIFESCNYPLEYINGRSCGSLPWEMKRFVFKKEQKADEETLREHVRKINDHYIDDLRYTNDLFSEIDGHTTKAKVMRRQKKVNRITGMPV